MAENEVKLKLNDMLKGIRLFKHEMEVIYFFAQARKLIEHAGHERERKYPIIRFYRDWAVHTQKSRNFGGIKPVLDDLYESCKLHIERWPDSYYPQKLKDFIDLTELKREIVQLSREFYIDTFMLQDQKCWQSFVKKLTAILNEQPIHSIPNSEIEGIEISNVSDRGLIIRVYLKNPVKGRDGEDMHWVELNNGFSL
jgi:hypothetical protein